MMFLSLLWLMQAQPPSPGEPPVTNTPSEWPGPEREMPGGNRVDQVSTPEARQTMARFAACVLDKSPEKVAEVLQANSAVRHGPFVTLMEAMLDLQAVDDEGPSEDPEDVREAERQLGVPEWVDPETGQLADDEHTRTEDH